MDIAYHLESYLVKAFCHECIAFGKKLFLFLRYFIGLAGAEKATHFPLRLSYTGCIAAGSVCVSVCSRLWRAREGVTI